MHSTGEGRVLDARIYTFLRRPLYGTRNGPPDPKLPEQNRKSFVASLAAQYGRRLRRFLFTRARNAADVPDLAQEVFLRGSQR